MVNTASLAEQLSDIHLPPPVPLWPAWPYTIALFALMVAVVWCLWRYAPQGSRRALKRQARRELHRIQQEWRQQVLSPEDTVLQLATWLKKVVRTCARVPASSEKLYGTDWLQYLDRTGNTRWFSTSEGQIFGLSHYQAQLPCLHEQHFKKLQQWLRCV